VDDRPGTKTGDSVISPTKKLCETEEPFGVRSLNTPASRQRRRFELISRGIDDALQGITSDPFGSLSRTGLRVPALVNTPATRYLFQLASFEVAEGRRARVVGLRNGYSIGYRQANPIYVNEFWVESPIWSFVDGNVSWHLRIMPLNFPFRPRPGPIAPPLQNFSFETADGSSLLYQVAGFPAPSGFYTTLNRYTPPNRGMPWGNPLGASLGNFNDLKVKWNDGANWHALDLPVEGPCRVALFASVLQTMPNNGETGRPTLTVPGGTVATFPLGLGAEEQFLQKFTNAIIWRVAGGLMVEEEDYKP
jgi:hypothetical protein